MSVLSQGGLILTAYLAAGRLGAVAACLFLGLSPWQSLITVLLIDLLQIPVYGLTLETSRRILILPERFQRWLKIRSERIRDGFRDNRVLQKAFRFRSLALVMVSTIPIRGFGILSACILALMLGFGRLSSTVLIMLGSFVGSLVLIGILFFSGRYLGVL